MPDDILGDDEQIVEQLFPEEPNPSPRPSVG